jgi:hypothetical protein
MTPSDIVLRCYAERERDGSWFAICIDLNLAAQAGSAKEVKAKLHAQIEQYVREALTVDRQYIDDLMPRRAPLSFRIRYHLARIACAIRGMKHHGDPAKRTFKEHLPVVLA